MLPFSVLAASATSLLLYLLVPRVGARFSVAGTLVISMAVAFAVADTVQLVLLPALGFSPLDLPFATWIFWFGLPTLLYIIVVGVEGGRMRSASLTGEQRASATLRTPMQGRPG